MALGWPLALVVVAAGAADGIAAGSSPDDAPVSLGRLRQTLAAGDDRAIADRTVLPFRFEGRRFDHHAFADTVVPALFTPGVRRCLRTTPDRPEDGRIVWWCAPYAFHVERAADGWRLVEFAVDGP